MEKITEQLSTSRTADKVVNKITVIDKAKDLTNNLLELQDGRRKNFSGATAGVKKICKPGHQSSECKAKYEDLYCSYCKKKGHVQKVCKQKEK